MKRLLIILIVLLCVCISGCGEQASSTKPIETNTEAFPVEDLGIAVEAAPQNRFMNMGVNPILMSNGGIIFTTANATSESGIYYQAVGGDAELICSGNFYNLQLINDVLYAVQIDNEVSGSALLYKIDLISGEAEGFARNAQIFHVFSDERLCYYDAKNAQYLLTDWSAKETVVLLDNASDVHMLSEGDDVIFYSSANGTVHHYGLGGSVELLYQCNHGVLGCCYRKGEIMLVMQNGDESYSLVCFSKNEPAAVTTIEVLGTGNIRGSSIYMLTEEEHNAVARSGSLRLGFEKELNCGFIAVGYMDEENDIGVSLQLQPPPKLYLFGERVFANSSDGALMEY